MADRFSWGDGLLFRIIPPCFSMRHAFFFITIFQIIGLVFVLKFLLVFFPVAVLLKTVYLAATGLAGTGLLLAGWIALFEILISIFFT